MHIAIVGSLFVSAVLAIWPIPIIISEGNTTIVLDETFTIEFYGPDGTMPDSCVDTSQKVWGAINRTYGLLNDGFVPYMLYPFEEDFEPAPCEMASAQRLTKLVIIQT
jgi:hypothetical protein